MLFKQNSVDNDARTNYYGIYGSTPRLVINGSAISSGSNYSSNSIFTAQQSQTTPASVSVTQSNFGTDSIKSTVIIKTEASHSLGTLALFVAMVEDTVTYTGGNNEKKHFDVYRKSASQTTGLRVTLPATVGDSQIYTFYTKYNSVWNKSRIYTLAILQDSSTKSLVQAAASKVIGNQVASMKTPSASSLISVYPNPAAEFANIAFNGTLPWNVEVYNSNGTKVYSKKVETMTTSIDLSALPASIYVIRAFNTENTVTQKIITH
ncbi:MAG: T9SS type A sorting domain-containing protein [Bacteroidia bacterium]|nr:T9SS type A sorting domain-containing protein [Bacteroidia bacterium]